MKRCLVTGACGFVGSHMARLLAEHGHDVLATDLASIPQDRLDPSVHFLPSDLTDPESLMRVTEDREWIFHVASLFDYSASWDRLASVNVHGTKHLVRAAVEANAQRFVLCSSVGVYGRPRPELLPTTEESPKVPSNDYERSKWEQELVVWSSYREKKLPVTIIRPAPIVGPTNSYGLGTAVFLIAKGQMPFYLKNNTNRSPTVHVSDVVGSALHLAERNETIGEAYTVCDDSQFRINEFAPYVAGLLGVKLIGLKVPLIVFRIFSELLGRWSLWEAKHLTGQRPKVELDTARYLSNDYRFSNEKLKSTGYVLKYPDVRVSLLQTVDWYKENGWV